jgi:hypothetical protein
MLNFGITGFDVRYKRSQLRCQIVDTYPSIQQLNFLHSVMDRVVDEDQFREELRMDSQQEPGVHAIELG